MNVDQLRRSNRIIFECISGSHAYGTNVETSDVDIRGFFVVPDRDYLSLIEPPKQIGDDKHDITYYSIRRAFELLQTANPNCIELLWMPEDCVQIMTPIMEKIIENRDLFISKKCFHTHSGYAYSQIKKARGQNKKVHNQMPKERPKKEDFCFIIPIDRGILKCDQMMPGRPVDIKNVSFLDGRKVCDPSCRPTKENGYGEVFNSDMDLSQFHISSVEHSHNVYRLYIYGEESKGVFRGDDMLVCESIPKDHEIKRFVGFLIYNVDEYNKAVKDWHSYWDWMNNRNSSRWIDQEKGKLNYDQKNLMHCMRLLMSGESILKKGFPIVRFEGLEREYLMSIRNGELDYDDIMNEVDKRMSKLEDLYKTSDEIPHSVNVKKINELYMELRGC